MKPSSCELQRTQTYTSQSILFVMPCIPNSDYMQSLPLRSKWVEFLKTVCTDVSEESLYPLGEIHRVISRRTITRIFITVRTANIVMYAIRNSYHLNISLNSWKLNASVKILLCRMFRPYISETREAMYIQGYSSPGFPNSTAQQPRQTRQKGAYQ